MMRKAVLSATVVGAAALAFGVAGCSSSSSSSSASGSSTTSSSAVQVGIILPDTVSSARYVNADAPALTAECKVKALNCDIQNAQGVPATQQSLADKMINTEHVQVLILDPLNTTVGAAIEKEAHAAGVKTIDYDRLDTGASPDYYVSYDNTKVGQLQGQALVDAAKAMGITKPDVAILDGATTDHNAVLFNQGYMSVLNPLIKAGTWKEAGEQWVTNWDNPTAGTDFTSMYNKDHNINVVMVANDGMANAVIQDLKNLGIAGKVVVSGQDSSAAGLQNILSGDQSFSIYKAAKGEAVPAVDLAAQIIGGNVTETFTSVTDPTNNTQVKSILATPVVITKSNVDQPVKGGDDKYSDVCTSAFAAACSAAGITQ
ncbi:sugar ABC transporter substrate-binding protein [Actinospica robiniae]|uniref:sugar ABC transporter substrate-binding protein n=1 Tax=Actinospica robiniae TaxID=304901 RepID=UPI00040C3709|nr:substrate-binding domain-containing protein [Actinospica robiniae]